MKHIRFTDWRERPETKWETEKREAAGTSFPVSGTNVLERVLRRETTNLYFYVSGFDPAAVYTQTPPNFELIKVRAQRRSKLDLKVPMRSCCSSTSRTPSQQKAREARPKKPPGTALETEERSRLPASEVPFLQDCDLRQKQTLSNRPSHCRFEVNPHQKKKFRPFRANDAAQNLYM